MAKQIGVYAHALGKAWRAMFDKFFPQPRCRHGHDVASCTSCWEDSQW